MKKILLTAMAASLITLGCSKEEDELPEPNPGAVTAVDALAVPSEGASGATQTPVVFDPANFGPPVQQMADFGAADRPLGDNGNAMDDLEYLNALVFRFNESRSSYSPEPEPQFRTQEEYQKYSAALKKLREPITVNGG